MENEKERYLESISEEGKALNEIAIEEEKRRRMNSENKETEYEEWVLWKDAKLPTWCPILLKEGKVVTGTMECNTPPKGKVIGEFVYEGDPVFSTPIVTLYAEEK